MNINILKPIIEPFIEFISFKFDYIVNDEPSPKPKVLYKVMVKDEVKYMGVLPIGKEIPLKLIIEKLEGE